ncbi:hypothetical protein I302_100509 [Kwoniella bestiolae CBS 10118]|uniref:Uncharacterized protein n=1 Tax=Kwoniella bestiolae CBS 10118 TaxID=1296100 RepID=A0A1B9G5B3_9TREE|nr:hypothetical protein I302_03882 [Kwoniella bestiolae CBS 10118]OCF26203.1 hypothetical protein I302_03882 [Kwoniella bestiolae CBS 10118]
MSMFSSFSFKSLDESPQPRAIPKAQPVVDEDVFDQDHEYDSYHSSSGFASGRQSRSSLTALAEDDEEEDQGASDKLVYPRRNVYHTFAFFAIPSFVPPITPIHTHGQLA